MLFYKETQFENPRKRSPYTLTVVEPGFNQTLYRPPFHVRLFISGIPAEPLFANDEVYQLSVTDLQYSTKFENGDIPVEADTERIVDVVMSSKHCSRLTDYSQKTIQGNCQL